VAILLYRIALPYLIVIIASYRSTSSSSPRMQVNRTAGEQMHQHFEHVLSDLPLKLGTFKEPQLTEAHLEEFRKQILTEPKSSFIGKGEGTISELFSASAPGATAFGSGDSGDSTGTHTRLRDSDYHGGVGCYSCIGTLIYCTGSAVLYEAKNFEMVERQ
jgi:hypothetical protein